MLEYQDEYSSDMNSTPKFDNRGEERGNTNLGSITPLTAISIITLIGLVCVVIDFYLEKEEE